MGIETKLRTFRIQSYFGKRLLVSDPVGPDAREGVGHKPLGKHVLSMGYGSIYVSPKIPHTLGL